MTVIVMTMVYNEGFGLKRWLDHYGNHVGEKSLFVIDHGSDDGSTTNIGKAGRLILPRLEFDDLQRTLLINDLQRDFFRYFDTVIYTDCDEFILPDPNHHSSLLDYAEHMQVDCVRPVGLDLLHLPANIPPVDYSRPMLMQRHYCQFRSIYCKPLIVRKPCRWSIAFHHCDRRSLIDPSLYLIHTKYADRQSAMQRQALTRTLPWSAAALASGVGQHQRMSDYQLISSLEARALQLHNEGAQQFDFKMEAAQFNSGLVLEGGIWSSKPFDGAIFEVPDRLRTAL